MCSNTQMKLIITNHEITLTVITLGGSMKKIQTETVSTKRKTFQYEK